MRVNTGNYTSFYSLRNYTQKSCEFECHLRQSQEVCGCVPWNYPQLAENITEICDGPGAYCFERQMEKGFTQASCGCIPNCEEVRFSINQSKFKRHFKLECEGSDLRVLRKPQGETSGYHFLNPPLKRRRDAGSQYDLATLVGEKLR
jgi:hypothetical protein